MSLNFVELGMKKILLNKRKILEFFSSLCARASTHFYFWAIFHDCPRPHNGAIETDLSYPQCAYLYGAKLKCNPLPQVRPDCSICHNFGYFWMAFSLGNFTSTSILTKIGLLDLII